MSQLIIVLPQDKSTTISHRVYHLGNTSTNHVSLKLTSQSPSPCSQTATRPHPPAFGMLPWGFCPGAPLPPPPPADCLPLSPGQPRGQRLQHWHRPSGHRSLHPRHLRQQRQRVWILRSGHWVQLERGSNWLSPQGRSYYWFSARKPRPHRYRDNIDTVEVLSVCELGLNTLTKDSIWTLDVFASGRMGRGGGLGIGPFTNTCT